MANIIDYVNKFNDSCKNDLNTYINLELLNKKIILRSVNIQMTNFLSLFPGFTMITVAPLIKVIIGPLTFAFNRRAQMICACTCRAAHARSLCYNNLVRLIARNSASVNIFVFDN